MISLKPETIRGRLTLWYTFSTIVVFILLSATVGTVLWQVLHEQIDHHLQVVLSEGKQIVDTHSEEERDVLLHRFVTEKGMTVVLLAPDGTPLLETTSQDVTTITQQQLQEILLSTGNKTPFTQQFTFNSQRFITTSVTVKGGKGLLAVGYSLEVVNNTFKTLISIIGLIMILALGLIVFGGQALLSRYLHPLEDVSNTAQRVSSSRNLAIRIPKNQKTEELRSLVSSLNTMITRLEEVFKKEHEFFSDAAHTLKTPLAVIRSQLELLPAKDASRKQKLLTTVDQAAATVDDLLLISRLETYETKGNEMVDLSRVLKELSDITSTLAFEKDITVVSAVHEGIFVLGNNHLLKRALGNILQNAVSYTPKGGKISISLSKHSSKNIEIIIKDSGIGIPKKDIEHVFDRFYRGKNSKTIPGSGIGLAITKATINIMGGKILVHSEKNHGTTFCIFLPVSN